MERIKELIDQNEYTLSSALLTRNPKPVTLLTLHHNSLFLLFLFSIDFVTY